MLRASARGWPSRSFSASGRRQAHLDDPAIEQRPAGRHFVSTDEEMPPRLKELEVSRQLAAMVVDWLRVVDRS